MTSTAFLKWVDEPEHLYLVGDVIDGWSFCRGWYWSQENNNLVRKLLSLFSQEQATAVIEHLDGELELVNVSSEQLVPSRVPHLALPGY